MADLVKEEIQDARIETHKQKEQPPNWVYVENKIKKTVRDTWEGGDEKTISGKCQPFFAIRIPR